MLHGIDYTMPMASAQVKSAVLLAGLAAQGRTRVTEPAPTRDHTERMLAAFGVNVQREGASASLEGGQPLIGTDIEVPADFSSAAFFLVAGALARAAGSAVAQRGVNPTRTGLLQMLQLMGAHISVHPHGAQRAPPSRSRIWKCTPSRLRGIEVPAAPGAAVDR